MRKTLSHIWINILSEKFWDVVLPMGVVFIAMIISFFLQLVRSKGKKDMQIELEYRDFTPEMLKSFVSQSKSCSQEVGRICYYIIC